jgi:hypothetical protein
MYRYVFALLSLVFLLLHLRLAPFHLPFENHCETGALVALVLLPLVLVHAEGYGSHSSGCAASLHALLTVMHAFLLCYVPEPRCRPSLAVSPPWC